MRAVDGSGVVLERFGRLFSRGTLAGRSDGELLERFATGRDEGAFEVLVARHGTMVLAACRSATGDRHAAEDAFQATFLILARKAGSIRVEDSLGRWLRGVARRVATRAAVQEARRRAREGSTSGSIAVGPDRPAERDELRVIVREEIARLPEADRDAVRACYLDGQTCAEAARRLGMPVGTIKARLARVRARLRDRLARRGLGAPAVLPIAGAIPEALIARTAEAARLYASGGTRAAGMVSAAVANLVHWGVFRMMIVSRLKMSALGLALVGVGAAGAVGLSAQGPDDGPPGERPRAAKLGEGSPPTAGVHVPDRPDNDSKAAEPAGGRPPTERNKVALPEYVVEPPDILRIKMKDRSDIGGEFLVRPDGTIRLGYYGDVSVSGLTLREIKEKIIHQLRKNLSDEDLGLNRREEGRSVAVAPAESAKLFVDVSAYNSKFYYVLGDVAAPGRFPITGSETVLDAIQQAGGLLPTASKARLRLIRPAPPGASPARKLPVDLAAIEQGDPTTNYQMMPGDRLHVDRDPKATAMGGETLVKVYSVADLIAPRLDHDPSVAGPPRVVHGVADLNAPRPVPSGTDPKPLIDLIRATVAPGTWSDGKGADPEKPGSITPHGLSLIIRQTPAGHDEIVQLLRQLRRIAALRGPEPAVHAQGHTPPAQAAARLEQLESRVEEFLKDLKSLRRKMGLVPPVPE